MPFLEDATSPTLRYTPGPLPGVIFGMKWDPDGIYYLGKNGVVRSLKPIDGEWIVIDYRQLDPSQIRSFVSHMSELSASEYEGVDGRNVLDAGTLVSLDPADSPSPPILGEL